MCQMHRARATFGGNAQGRRYGFGHSPIYFTNRQLTALCTFSDLVGEARERVLVDSDGDDSYADASRDLLAFAVTGAPTRIALSRHGTSHPKQEAIRNTSPVRPYR